MKRELVYKGFERFWHWAQSALILFLALTGFEIHGTISFFGFDQAVRFHSFAAWSLLVLIAFAVFWHFTTGEWKHYVPTLANIRTYVHYYTRGIFRGEPHPAHRRLLSKLNPLQKLVYAALKVFIIPSMVVTGLLYMFYRYPQRYEVAGLRLESLHLVAVLHTFGAFLIVAFVVAHLYLITTGQTLSTNLKVMITGYEETHEPETKQTPAQPETV